MRLGVSVALVLLAAALAGSTTRAGVPGAPRVLLIGDSVATGMQWHNDAIAVLEQDLNVTWQVAVCRRLVGLGCTFEGVTPPSLVSLVSSLGPVPPVVVVEMGYNDYQATFAASVEQSIELLLAHGAQHILWLTLRAVRHPYVQMNAVLAAAARRHPEVSLVDWNRYARGHPDWFQSDGEHLMDAGGLAMATLIHLAVDEVTNPLGIVSAPLPLGRVGVPYSVSLSATGGEPPYRWQLRGSPPSGLHLLADGRLYGVPRKAQRVAVTVRVADAEGQVASRRLAITVAPSP